MSKSKIGRTCCVLAVDDEALVLNMISRFLTRIGCHVTTCTNAAEALKCLEKQEFDALLLDVRMPDINGMELFLMIQGRWPEMVKRIGFVTGNVPTDEVQSLLERTGCPILLKPFGLDEIESFVCELVG